MYNFFFCQFFNDPKVQTSKTVYISNSLFLSYVKGVMTRLNPIQFKQDFTSQFGLCRCHSRSAWKDIISSTCCSAWTLERLQISSYRGHTWMQLINHEATSKNFKFIISWTINSIYHWTIFLDLYVSLLMP